MGLKRLMRLNGAKAHRDPHFVAFIGLVLSAVLIVGVLLHQWFFTVGVLAIIVVFVSRIWLVHREDRTRR